MGLHLDQARERRKAREQQEGYAEKRRIYVDLILGVLKKEGLQVREVLPEDTFPNPGVTKDTAHNFAWLEGEVVELADIEAELKAEGKLPR